MAPKKKPGASSTPADENAADDHADAEACLPMTEDFITRITQSLTKAFTSSFNECVDKLLISIDQRLNRRIDVLETSIFDLNKRADDAERANKKLVAENVVLRDSIASLTAKSESLTCTIDDLEQYSRGSNLMIHGIQPQPDDNVGTNLAARVVTLLNSNLGVSVHDNDLSTAHRVRRVNASSSGNPKPPPVVIQFNNRAIRSDILSKRKHLKGRGLSITEQLTPRRMNLLKKAGELVIQHKILSSWSHDGRILIKSLDNRIVPILMANDLIPFN
jgi:hypothetical protein